MRSIQLYSVRNYSEKNFKDTIKQIVEMGYTGLEFAGYYDIPPKELKEYIDSLGAKAINAHVSLDALLNNYDEELGYAKTLEMPFITIPYLSEENRKEENLSQLFQNIIEVKEKLAKENICLAYHNHSFEFEIIDDKYFLDLLVEKTGIYLELDTFWVEHAGVNSIDYMKKNMDHILLIHLKDMNKQVDQVRNGTLDEPVFAPFNTGSLPLRKIYETARDKAMVIVEQDDSLLDQMETAKINLEFLKSIE